MKRVWITGWISAAVFVLCTCFAAAAHGQELNLTQFLSLSAPGARANAMGRAFIGVADDASAAVTNPAGLVLLTRPQVYVEFKSSHFNEDLDADFRIRPPQFAVSFLGASAPLGESAAVAFSYHEYASLDFFFEGIELNDRGRTYAGSIAGALGQNLRVGVTVGVSRFQEEDISDETAVVVTGGVLWTATEKVSVGVTGAASSENSVSPRRFGAGVGFRPSSRALLAFDLGWVGYSSVEFTDPGSAFETHAGGEYLLVPGDNRLFVRAGFYTTSQDRLGGTEAVGTFGAGLALGRRVQFDVAFLTRKEVVASAAFRF